MSTTTAKVFDHGILQTKAYCQGFLRELGVARDWARVSIGEMRTMLRKYPDEKLFAAAKALVERDGDTFIRSEFEIDSLRPEDENDNIPVTTATITTAPAPIAAAAKEAAKPAPTASPAMASDASELAAMLTRILANQKATLDPEQVKAIALEVANDVLHAKLPKIGERVKELIEEAMKSVGPREIIIKTEASEIKIDGLQHHKFEDLLRACSARLHDGHRLNVWLYGPPGTGKTQSARNVAKALALDFYSTGSLLTKYDITGFIAAQGELIRSPFREAWEKGGVFLFDEVDGSDPKAIVAFNAALANGVMAFPDGMIDRHTDCVMIAAANTNGQGATADFNGRVKLDGASMDRFIMMDWPIDERIEDAITPNKEWLRIVRIVRGNVARQGIKNICVSPRASIYGSALLATGLKLDTVKSMVLRKGMNDQQWAQVSA